MKNEKASDQGPASMPKGRQASDSSRYHIDPKAPISELILEFPEIAEVLTYDYGLHCVNCMISDFDTLEEGALIHGIEGDEFNEMIQDLESTIQDILDNKAD